MDTIATEAKKIANGICRPVVESTDISNLNEITKQKVRSVVNLKNRNWRNLKMPYIINSVSEWVDTCADPEFEIADEVVNTLSTELLGIPAKEAKEEDMILITYLSLYCCI